MVLSFALDECDLKFDICFRSEGIQREQKGVAGLHHLPVLWGEISGRKATAEETYRGQSKNHKMHIC